EKVFQAEGLEANTGVEHELMEEIRPGDLHVEPVGRQVALGPADIGSVLKQLRGDADTQTVDVQIIESRGCALDSLRVAIREEIDPVFSLDDLLIDDQLLALVLANLGQ